MRSFNLTLLAVFSCIAMIGATPLRAEAIGRRHILDCNEYQDEPVCVACDDNPFQEICSDICVEYPEISFCSTICDKFPDLSFCESD